MKTYKVVLCVALAALGSLNACKKSSNDSSKPSIDFVSKTYYVAGGEITITGNNMANATVTIGGKSCVLVSNSETFIITKVPNGVAIGSNQVKVTTNKGSATKDIMVGLLPVITKITPAAAAIGESVTISGTWLGNGGVLIATKVAKVNYSTDTTINIVIPSGIAKGAAAVMVLTYYGEFTTGMTIN